MTRQKKTERQRAEEALAIAERKADRLRNEAARLEADLAAVKSDLAEADRILDYRRQHPALPQQPSKTPTTEKETNPA